MTDKQIIANLTAKLESATKPKWVSVSDRLPENERVIAYTPNEDLCVQYRFIPAGLFKQVASDATHWQTLPTQPEAQ